MFSEFFEDGHRQLLEGRRIGFVIPQQSLRASVKAVFKQVPGLDPELVMTPFQVGASSERFDLLIVDEAHRLNQRSAQAMGTLTKQFGEINMRLFGEEGANASQLDWITHQSDHQIFLVDAEQTVRPSDLPREVLGELKDRARTASRWYPLTTQMRVSAGSDYVGYVKRLLRGEAPPRPDFGGYDLRFFVDFDEMYEATQQREREVGLSRLVAGYAWPWRSRKDSTAYDIELGSHGLRWNSTQTDWINSSNSINEVGSIHTVQGYDLNYAGVIIGGDLEFDEATGTTRFVRERYFDTRGRANNNFIGRQYTDDDLLKYIRNIYAVLMTRGILGTFVYVEDPALRERLREAIT